MKHINSKLFSILLVILIPLFGKSQSTKSYTAQEQNYINEYHKYYLAYAISLELLSQKEPDKRVVPKFENINLNTNLKKKLEKLTTEWKTGFEQLYNLFAQNPEMWKQFDNPFYREQNININNRNDFESWYIDEAKNRLGYDLIVNNALSKEAYKEFCEKEAYKDCEVCLQYLYPLKEWVVADLADVNLSENKPWKTTTTAQYLKSPQHIYATAQTNQRAASLNWVLYYRNEIDYSDPENPRSMFNEIAFLDNDGFQNYLNAVKNFGFPTYVKGFSANKSYLYLSVDVNTDIIPMDVGEVKNLVFGYIDNSSGEKKIKMYESAPVLVYKMTEGLSFYKIGVVVTETMFESLRNEPTAGFFFLNSNNIAILSLELPKDDLRKTLSTLENYLKEIIQEVKLKREAEVVALKKKEADRLKVLKDNYNSIYSFLDGYNPPLNNCGGVSYPGETSNFNQKKDAWYACLNQNIEILVDYTIRMEKSFNNKMNASTLLSDDRNTLINKLNSIVSLGLKMMNDINRLMDKQEQITENYNKKVASNKYSNQSRGQKNYADEFFQRIYNEGQAYWKEISKPAIIIPSRLPHN